MRSPRRPGTLASAIISAALLLVLPVAALAQDVERIDLPGGWQPEGITTDGSSLFVGSLADGAIWRGDPVTGEGDVFIAGAEGSVAAGIDAEVANGRLWVAGGPTGVVRAHDLATGELLESWSFEAGFLNDLVATPEAVYVTDSMMPQLIVIPLAEDGSLPAAEEATTVPISGDLVYGEGFNLNGIVAAEGGLVTVHSPTGGLYHILPTGETSLIDTGGADLTAGDGMELVGSTLHVIRNQVGRVAILELAPDLASATLVSELAPEGVDVPTTAAFLGDALWAVNARFGTEATPETEYWITRIDPAAASGESPAASASPTDAAAG